KYASLLFVFIAQLNFAQTGIGTTTPNASAKLDVYSTNKGFLPPRVTLTSATDATTITSPAEGLLVYNLGSVGLQAGYYYWNGANWATIATATSAGNGVTASNMVNLYSKGYSNATADSTIANATGYKFTVPVSGRYLFDFSCSGFSNATITFKVRQGTTDLGTDAQTSYNNSVHVEYNGKIEVNLQAGVTYNVYVTTTGNRDAGDYDRVYYKLVAGNLPVTGQTVEYGIVKYTGNETGALTTGSIVSFDATASGNLSWSANKFTLKANKTYELESYLSIYQSAGGVAGVFQIYDYTNSTPLANGFYISINGAGSYNPNGNGPMRAIVTPTSDIAVGIKFVSYYGSGSPGLIGSTNYVGTNAAANQCYFMVKQIGSSAIVDPWVLSGTNAYNITGNVGIGTNSPTVSLEVAGNAKVSGILNAGGNALPNSAGVNGQALTTNGSGTASWNPVPPTGVVSAYAGSVAPLGYLLCDGSAVNRTTYSALYAIIGTTYGIGDGSTTFNVPDLRGRVPVGKNTGTFSSLGLTGGEESHTMTVNEMPAHKHTTSVNSAVDPSAIGGYAPSSQSMFFGTDRAGTTANWSTAMQNTGGGQAFNNLQPYVVLNYIIKY
ncbi:MAG: Microbacterium phage TinyTimothy, partial [Bacteroidota bacterium]